MKKKIILFLLAIIMLLAIGVIINIFTARISYSKWVVEYLQNRYTENMIVKKVRFGDMGYYAEVFPENEPDLEFSVRGKYIDTYLERFLESQAERELKSIYPEYDCSVQLFSAESNKTQFVELYQLYVKYNRPANWDEIPEYVRLEKLRINTNQYIDDASINSIINTILLSDFRTNLIEIYNSDKLYKFQYDEINHIYIPV